MNNFCRHLRLSLLERFDNLIMMWISMFLKKKLFHMSLVRSLLSYHNFEGIIDFVKKYWKKNKTFLSWLFLYLSKIKSEPKMDL